MMRHSVIFAAQVIEPDPAGEWVKHQEAVALESVIKAKDRLIASLTQEQDALRADFHESLKEKDGLIARQEKTIKAAQARLKIHGHSPNCASRYGTIDLNGSRGIRACNCGLDAWFHESGFHHG
jgi:hypothetical protein